MFCRPPFSKILDPPLPPQPNSTKLSRNGLDYFSLDGVNAPLDLQRQSIVAGTKSQTTTDRQLADNNESEIWLLDSPAYAQLSAIMQRNVIKLLARIEKEGSRLLL